MEKEGKTESMFMNAFMAGVKEKVEEIAQEIIMEYSKLAADKITIEVKKVADNIALNVLSYYNVQEMETQVIISLKKNIELA